jgi:hypothetical protein
MTDRTKLILAGVGAAAATGLWFGYTRAESFLPGMTPQYLHGLERDAKRASKGRGA